MRIISALLFTCLLFSSTVIKSQDIPEITGEELPGFSLERNQVFDGNSLWGYMNGGADIYLEYGFEVLRVEEFIHEEESIKLELFKMHDPLSAFGIYSIKTFRCEQDSALVPVDCLNSYQYQLFYGRYYIQLTNENGSEKARPAMMDIAYVLLPKLEPEAVVLPLKYLTDSLNIPITGIKMLKGELGIQNRTYELQDYFKGLSGYQLYYAKKEVNGREIKYFEAVFADPDMKSKFKENIKDEEMNVIRESKNSLLFTLLF